MLRVSVTSLLNYARCPYSFYLYKTTDIKEIPRTKETATGKAFHRIVKSVFSGKSFEEALGEVLVVDDNLVDTSEVRLFYSLYKDEMEKLREEGIYAIEKYFEIEYDGVVINGYIDLITKKGKLVEIKTTKQNIYPKLSHVFQVSVYKLLGDANSYEIHYISPKGVFKIPVKPYPVEFILDVIKQIQNLIETNEYPALGLLNGFCRFCLFKNMCEFYLSNTPQNLK